MGALTSGNLGMERRGRHPKRRWFYQSPANSLSANQPSVVVAMGM